MLDDNPLPPVEPDSGYYSTKAIADYAVRFLEEHDRCYADSPFFMYLAFFAPHFPLHALHEDIDFYRGKYDQGWDRVRDARMRRLTDMGLVDCELSPRQLNTKPSWNLSPEELTEKIGEGEVARAFSWRKLNAGQQAFQARKMEIHAAMIHRLDREAGRVIDQLKAMGQWENTVTMFVSDNGASAEQIIRFDGHDKNAEPGSWRTHLCLGPGWSTVSITPFRYHKSWVHEGGISSPLIVHWPEGIDARGELRHTPCHFVDIVPTMLELAGQETDPEWRGKDSPPLAGVSFVQAMHDDCDIKREYIFFRHIGHRALRVGNWKLVAVNRGKWELYDMESDRSELHNLAKEYPDRVKRMSALWEQCHKRFIIQSGMQRD